MGVVGDVKPDRVEDADWPTVYCPYAQAAHRGGCGSRSDEGPPLALASAGERAVRQLDPDQAVADLRTMDEVVDRAIAGQRFDTVLLGIFARDRVRAGAVGIYGVVSYDVGERTSEIGIRLALGARKTGDVLRLVLAQPRAWRRWESRWGWRRLLRSPG